MAASRSDIPRRPLPVGLVLCPSQPQLVIGHFDTADLVPEDRFVSRGPALVTVDPTGAVTITDLNSTGGRSSTASG